MAFAQLTYRESLRDIEVCLAAQAGKLYDMGISAAVASSTLADANEFSATGAHDHQGSRALRRRGLRHRTGQYHVCPRCHDHRSVPVDVPVGAVSLHQRGREIAHAARSAGIDPHLHPHLRRQNARLQCAGPASYRGRRLEVTWTSSGSTRSIKREASSSRAPSEISMHGACTRRRWTATPYSSATRPLLLTASLCRQHYPADLRRIRYRLHRRVSSGHEVTARDPAASRWGPKEYITSSVQRDQCSDEGGPKPTANFGAFPPSIGRGQIRILQR